MRALVTGGCGGSAVVRHLVGAGHHVLNVDKLTYSGDLRTVAAVDGVANYQFERQDITDQLDMAKIFAGFAPDGVFHLAAESHAVAFARELSPSARGELEITDINRRYLATGNLRVTQFGRGVAWLDGGTHQDLYEASQFIKVIEERTGLKVACPEEVAWRMKFIDDVAFERLIDPNPVMDYQRYLRSISETSRPLSR